MSTHDYKTKMVKGKDLNNTHVFVGESGGLSAVYENLGIRYDIRVYGVNNKLVASKTIDIEYNNNFSTILNEIIEA